MKNILYYSIAAAVIILLSLFLPYESHDMQSGGFFKPQVMLGSGYTTSGLSHVSAFFPVLVILVCLIIIKINENLATAIVSLVVSFVNLIYMAFLAFILQFHLNLFNGPTNYELEIGYYLALLTVVAYLIVTIIHLIVVIRKRRNQKTAAETVSNPDLLDDALDF